MSLALDWKSISYPGYREDARRREEMRQAEKWRRKQAEKARRMRLLFFSFLVVTLLVSGILLLSIWLHVTVVQCEVRMREVERQIELERRSQDAARTEISSLESPGRIEKLAVEDLHMVPATQADYLETEAFKAARESGKEGDTEVHALAGGETHADD